jgi:hypothetical protein
MKELTDWENFYVIVGSSAGALIGLQFVVVTLMADMPAIRGAAQASGAFSTPSVVHFTVVLLLSAIISAPWQTIGPVAVVLGLIGIGGIAYSLFVTWRLRSQTAYKPVFEDWLFYALLPLAAYGMLAGSALEARSDIRAAMFLVGAAALVLLFVGIHNAWDTVTYHVFVQRRQQHEDKPKR